jgi:hypothetical protein
MDMSQPQAATVTDMLGGSGYSHLDGQPRPLFIERLWGSLKRILSAARALVRAEADLVPRLVARIVRKRSCPGPDPFQA